MLMPDCEVFTKRSERKIVRPSWVSRSDKPPFDTPSPRGARLHGRRVGVDGKQRQSFPGT
jgi:hypothetical protein